MNKIRQVITRFKSLSPKKAFGYIGIPLLVVLSFWYWSNLKTRETIKDHLFVIAADNRWFPLDLHGQEQYMVGFVTELSQNIAKEEEIKIQVVPIGTSQLMDNLEKGYYDGIFSSLNPNILNEKKYSFSEPFYLTGPVLVVPVKSKATSINELYTVGIVRGYSLPPGVTNSPKTSVIPFDNINFALSELTFGNIDGFLLDSIDAYAYVKGYYSGKLKVVTPPLDKEGLRLVTLNKFFGNELVKIFDQGLESIRKSKQYHKLLDKWELIDPETAYQPKLAPQ
jgi:ABC-type amino acid transport substrate-binding protein